MRQVLLKQLCLAVLFMGSCCLKAQCPEGGTVFLLNQQLIDNFNINYPNCTEVGGKLHIGSTGNDITNLNGLSNIVSTGGIRIQGTFVTSLEGLNNLETATLEIALMGNTLLTDITALNKLEETIGLNVSDNRLLTSLAGLENLQKVNGGVQIAQNPLLLNLNGLGDLNHIEGVLDISGNATMTNLDGIENLTTIGGLKIATNLSLQNLNGLTGVTSFVTQPFTSFCVSSTTSPSAHSVNPSQNALTSTTELHPTVLPVIVAGFPASKYAQMLGTSQPC